MAKRRRIFVPYVTNWVKWTPSGSWVTNVTYAGLRRRVGEMEEFDILVTCSGAPTATTLTFNLPVTIDTTKLLSPQANLSVIPDGVGYAADTAANAYALTVLYLSSTTVKPLAMNAAGATVAGASVTDTVPFTFGSPDFVQIHFSVPVVGYTAGRWI